MMLLRWLLWMLVAYCVACWVEAMDSYLVGVIVLAVGFGLFVFWFWL
jgi:hypothetical protein